MHSSRHARMIRTAISPRLATRTRRKGGAVSLRKDASRLTAPAGASERDVAMLLSRIGVPLRLQHVEGGDDSRTRLRRTDNVVDIAAGGRDVRVREFVLVRR